MLAERVPPAEGSKVTAKVVVPFVAATGEVGNAVTVKSAAFAPETTTLGEPESVKAAPPVFSMVKVLTIFPEATLWEPKSVWSPAIGVISPSTIETLLPLMSISGAITTAPVPCISNVYGF